MNYKKFIESKNVFYANTGLKNIPNLNSQLFDFQTDIVRWSLRRGKSAIFADCGMGKTPMQLEWSRHIPGRVLILAPLAVSNQTVKESIKFNVELVYLREDDKHKRIVITNYEMMDHFEADDFEGIVLDESSILKSFDGKFRTRIIEKFRNTKFKLACTATPSPNDYMELGNHSEFLNIMSRNEMLSMFFIHDGGDTSKWRLKGHAQSKFWEWVCSWAIMIRKPSDLGYDDRNFILPELKTEQFIVESKNNNSDTLFAMEALTLPERIIARRNTVNDRALKCADIIGTSKKQWIIWCNLNSESEQLHKMIEGSVEVKGSDSIEKKTKAMMNFLSGDLKVLITKPSICGFGMNWQNCSNVIFMGLSDSYEEYYQAVRRCWRFGQKNIVKVHIVIANIEGAVLENIKRKEEDAKNMIDNMVENMKDIERENVKGSKKEKSSYQESTIKGEGYEIKLGDCVDHIQKMEDDSIHYSIFSPPFASLYTYSNSDRDMGNSKSYDEFFNHFKFMAKELHRVLMPGRLISFHCMNLPTTKTMHGYIGITDFRGDLIRLFQEVGFIYHSEVVIWKDPVIAMQRTKALGLLHKQLKKDSCMSRQGIPDYLVTMRKIGDNPERVIHTNESFPVQVWQNYASPVWMDINPSDTLQFRMARENEDERHICPLQLGVIKRAINLWTNPSDLVLSPFAGIGSEGYVCLRLNRRYIGIELKKSYFDVAVNNLKFISSEVKDESLI